MRTLSLVIWRSRSQYVEDEQYYFLEKCCSMIWRSGNPIFEDEKLSSGAVQVTADLPHILSRETSTTGLRSRTIPSLKRSIEALESPNLGFFSQRSVDLHH